MKACVAPVLGTLPGTVPGTLPGTLPGTVLGALLGAMLGLAGCAAAGPAPAAGALAEPATATTGAAAALQRYAAALRAQDSAALAALFTPEGSMQNAGQAAITGREAIRRFLDSFSNYKVLSAEMSVLSSRASRRGGVEQVSQTGRFAQTVRAPDGKTLGAGGWFTAQWQHAPQGAWLIERLSTSPTPPPP